MLLTKSNGDELKIESIDMCKIYYPLFNADYNILKKEGIIKKINYDNYIWTKSKTSLAEYFKWITPPTEQRFLYGCWFTIEATFNIKRKTLARLASSNGNACKPTESEDFKKIKALVLSYREDIRQIEKEKAKLKNDFKNIKNLIKNIDNNDIETLRNIKEKIINTLKCG